MKTIREIIAEYIPNEDISAEMVDRLYEYKNQHIEFLENKVRELEKNLIDEYQYINNLTNITDKYCIREYTDEMIKELKQQIWVTQKEQKKK